MADRGQTDGGDCNIPKAFLKKRGDTNLIATKKHQEFKIFMPRNSLPAPSLPEQPLSEQRK